MDKTGAGKLLAKFCVDLLGGTPSPLFVAALLFLVSSFLTQFMSNTATATLLCPIGVAIAQQIGASPHAVVMSITIGIACAYATPVGTCLLYTSDQLAPHQLHYQLRKIIVCDSKIDQLQPCKSRFGIDIKHLDLQQPVSYTHLDVYKRQPKIPAA